MTTLPLEEIERKTISSITGLSDINYLKRSGIDANDFDIYTEVATFVLTYTQKFGGFPQNLGQVLQQTFPDFVFTQVSDSKYILDLFKKEVLTKKIRALMNKGNSYLRIDPDDAAAFILKYAKNLAKSATIEKSVTDGETASRFEQYLHRRSETQSLGFAQHISTWHDAMYYWSSGMLGFIWGRPGVGKSFFAMDLGIRISYLKDRKTVFISPEMSRYETEGRFDSLLGHYYNYTFDSAALIMGKDIHEAEYQKYLESIKGKGLWITYNSGRKAFTLDDIENIIDTESPYLVIIDGIRLIATEGRGEDWQKLMHIVSNLKNLAMTKNVIIFGVAQENRDEQVAYSDSIVQFADKMIHVALIPHRFRGTRIIYEEQPTDGAIEDPEVIHVTVTKNRSTGNLIRKSVPVIFNPHQGVIGDPINEHHVNSTKSVKTPEASVIFNDTEDYIVITDPDKNTNNVDQTFEQLWKTP